MALLRHADPVLLLICAGLLAVLLAARSQAGEAFAADAGFPGGNLIIEKVEGDHVYVRPDLRDTKGTWFWWHFRVRGAAGRTLTFHFTKGRVIGVRGPAVSTDGGATWAWLGTQAVRGATFHHAFPDDAGEVRFCFAMPYLQADLQAFLRRSEGNPHLRVEPLATTRRGRQNELLRVGRLDSQPPHRVLVTCRHHCCECMASYALEGLVEGMLAAAEDGQWLRGHVELMAIPFVDKDGVEDGDQGKNRKPHDHNRDYGDESIYPSVRAIKTLVPRWSQGRLRVALDLHCPHIRGPHNEVIYLVGSQNEAIWREQCRLGKILEAVRTGPLPYRAGDNLPFGKGWNTKENYGDGKSFARWAGELFGVALATTIEIPYANAGGTEVNADSARAFGGDLAKALRRYLASLPQAPSPAGG